MAQKKYFNIWTKETQVVKTDSYKAIKLENQVQVNSKNSNNSKKSLSLNCGKIGKTDYA